MLDGVYRYKKQLHVFAQELDAWHESRNSEQQSLVSVKQVSISYLDALITFSVTKGLIVMIIRKVTRSLVVIAQTFKKSISDRVLDWLLGNMTSQGKFPSALSLNKRLTVTLSLFSLTVSPRHYNTKKHCNNNCHVAH